MNRTIQAVLAGLMLATSGASAEAGAVLDKIKSQGALRCGVGGSIPTFSMLDSKGQWSGLDVDYCRAVASAVLVSPDKVAFAALSLHQRFPALPTRDAYIMSPHRAV